MSAFLRFLFLLSCSNKRSNNRHTDDIQLENDWVTGTSSFTPFDNPTFGEDTRYDFISTATGESLAEKLRQANAGGRQEPRLQNGTSDENINKASCNDSNGKCNLAYGLAYTGERSQSKVSEILYASPQCDKEQQKKECPGKYDDDIKKPADF